MTSDESAQTAPQEEDPEKPGVLRQLVSGLKGLLSVEEGSPLADMRVALSHIRLNMVVLGALGLLTVSYLLTGIYTVAPGEAAVVRRFGEVIHPRVDPGIHYSWPAPIDRVDIVNVNEVRREQVGALEPETDHLHPEPPSKLQALSGDTNVVDVEVIVQYQVRDPADYLVNVKYASYRVIRDTLRAAVTSLVTKRPVDALLTTGRQSLQDAIRTETQNRLDSYRSGLAVVGIDVQKAFPPDDVASAFTAVNTAREEKARAINEASGYANSQIPEARGDAERILAEAQAYSSDVLAAATGGAQAFEAILSEYRSNAAIYGEAVTRYRMYLETIDKIMSRVQVFAVDQTNGGKLNLRLFSRGAQGAAGMGGQ